MFSLFIYKIIYELKVLAANDKLEFPHKNRGSSAVKLKIQVTNLMKLLPNYWQVCLVYNVIVAKMLIKELMQTVTKDLGDKLEVHLS